MRSHQPPQHRHTQSWGIQEAGKYWRHLQGQQHNERPLLKPRRKIQSKPCRSPLLRAHQMRRG
jgi:hypothetical protein